MDGHKQGYAGIDSLMRPRSIAVVGASAKGNRGTTILRNLRRFGFEGELYAVNPNYSTIEGVPCAPSLSDLPIVPEFVAFAVPAKAAVDSVAIAAKLGSRAGLIIGGGYGEGAGHGSNEASELAEVCRRTGFRLCGPNCYGIVNVHDRFAAFSGDIVEPFELGQIGFAVQSGAITHAVHESAIGRGLGISYIVTSGNELSVDLSEYIEWMVDDDRTQIIAAFIEGLRDPERFARVAEKALAVGKPIVALKVGRTASGQAATIAHTGSLAGTDGAYEGLFKKLGIIRVDDVDDMRETLLLMSCGRKPSGKGVAIASISGGMISMLTDMAEMTGLETPQPSETTQAILKEALPDFGTAKNPLDTTGVMAERPEILKRVAEAFLTDDRIAAFALAFNSPHGSEGQSEYYWKQAAILAETQANVEKPLIAFAMPTGRIDPKLSQILGDADVPLLIGAKSSVSAIKRWVDYHERRRVMAGDRGRLASGRSPIDLEDTPTRFLAEEAASMVLSQRGLPFVQTLSARSKQDAVRAADQLGYPVVLKINSPDVAHKTEYGGVFLSLRDADEIASAYDRIISSVTQKLPSATVKGVLVQRMAPKGVEVLLGVNREPGFGLQLVVGLGGVFVELLNSVSMRPIPITAADAEEMIAETYLDKLIQGFRGGPPADRDALIQAMLSLSDAACDLGSAVSEIDVNPFVVLEKGKGAIALDALIVLGDRQ